MILAISKFTLNDMGIIEDSNNMNLNRFKYHYPLKLSKQTITNDIRKVIIKRSLEMLLSSLSNLPYFVTCILEFIYVRVSTPV